MRLRVAGFIWVRVGMFRRSYPSPGSFWFVWVHSGACRFAGIIRDLEAP